MEINYKLKRRILIISGILIVLFIAFSMVMVKMIKENGKCVDDPFKYSAVKLKDSGGNYNCYCESLDPELLDFSFNEDGIKIIKPNDFNINNLNFSNIEVKGGNEE